MLFRSPSAKDIFYKRCTVLHLYYTRPCHDECHHQRLHISSKGAHAHIKQQKNNHKGVLTEKVFKAVIHRAKNSKKRVLVDPKSSDFTLYKGATLVTPNQREVEQAVPIKIQDRNDLDRAAEYLLNLTHTEVLLITRGKDGMMLYQNKEEPVDIDTQAKEVFDVTGAGDTVVSVLGMALAIGFNYKDSAWLSNIDRKSVV